MNYTSSQSVFSYINPSVITITKFYSHEIHAFQMAAKVKVCRCDSKPCASGCPCFKAKTLCTPDCHSKAPWENVPCLNTEAGLRVKEMKPAEIRKGLCDAGLSPIGDRNEIQKRLAVLFSSLAKKSSSNEAPGDADHNSNDHNSSDDQVKDLMEAIIANEGDFIFILSLSGKMVKATSSKAELRKAYFILSSKVHPDKNSNSAVSKQAFQAVLEAFERLANPEKFEEDKEDDDDGKPAKKRKKTERFTRGNSGCFSTVLRCPRCKDVWNTKNLGLEDAAYNFMMQGVKQYLCGGCFAKFGCMTAIHRCPHCRKTFEYDPDDYHRKITCGNNKCDREFGFWMFNVAARREQEIRREVKLENEALAKTRAQQRRRGARAEKRVGTQTNEQRVQEQLFVLKLVDNCPRCGWELQRDMNRDDAKEHIKDCNDEKLIKAHQQKLAKRKELEDSRKKGVENQEEVLAYKTWELNGRQVGQLWMLSENILMRECKKYNIEADGPKHVLIAKLGQEIRIREKRMITMGGEDAKYTHDITPIHKVDEEDLPLNMNCMDSEELKCVAASYGLDFDSKNDVKMDILKKLESARLKGSGLLMILDDQSDNKSKRKRKNSDEDFKVTKDPRGGDSD